MKKKKICLFLMVLLPIYLSSKFLYEDMLPYFSADRSSIAGEDLRDTQVQIFQKVERTEEKKKENLQLYARSAALLDASSGRILFEKDGKRRMPMASTTKIMTCIVVLEHASLDDIVTISSNAARQPDVQLHVKAGEKYILEDLLYSLMLESHNDVAVALAEHVGGSVEGFAKLMNQKAKELGCRNTHFVTPNGLDAKEHYTTAEELCRIAAYAIKNTKFVEIVNMPGYAFAELNTGRSFTVSNKDRFLTMYEGAIGIKTGFTGNAGYCFVGAVRQSDRTLISAVLASGWPPNKNYKWSDTKKLMDYGCKYYKEQTLFEEKVSLPKISVIKGRNNKVSLTAKQESVSMLLDGKESHWILMETKKKLRAPVKKGEVVGILYYYIDGKLVKTTKIYTSQGVEREDFGFVFQRIWKAWVTI